MQRTHHHKHGHHRHHTAAGEMLTHAGLEGLLASIPAAVVMTVKESVGANVQATLRGAIDKGEKAVGEVVNHTAGRLQMSKPVIVGAVIIGAALLHGAWRGKRKHEEHSFREEEDARRVERELRGWASNRA